MNYLEKLNLRSSKYLDSLDWIVAAKIIIDDKHFTLELFRIGITSTEKGRKKENYLLKNRMNRNRTIMDWKHLDKY